MEIDGVFSGGGVKGFALIGAYEAIEEKGFRFKTACWYERRSAHCFVYCSGIYKQGNRGHDGRDEFNGLSR